jgi:glycosyltransferase involved in cell wall biosynthesis
MRSLFLTYDSLLSPLGQSQILPYLRGLHRKGHEVSVLSFERAGDGLALAQLRSELVSEKIDWKVLRYHKSPTIPATAFDVVSGIWAARVIVRRKGIQLLHARSYVPMLIALLAASGRKIIFDMRGFWADERVDGNRWTLKRASHKLLYRMAKRLERVGLTRADHVVVLTHVAHRMLGDIAGAATALPPVTVIPTCVDLIRFQPAADKAAARRELGLPATPIFVYQGQVGTRYLLSEMVAFVGRARLRWNNLLFLILAPAELDLVRETCRAAGLTEGVHFRLEALPHNEVARWVRTADAALCFMRPVYSALATCPTKLAECLACGIPVVANAGVGDVAQVLTENRVGPVMAELTNAAYERALNELEALWDHPDISSRCRHTAETCFALSDAIASYDEIYKSLDAGKFR